MNFSLTGPYFEEKVWAGSELSKIKQISMNSIGESFEVSTLKGKNSSVLNGKPLEDFFKLNYLTKIIDTNSHLSLQVHPDDDYAKLHHNETGKDECWLILKADPGSGVYLAPKVGMSKVNFEQAVKNQDDLSTSLNFYEVTAGDFIHVPARTLHAIGAGVTLVEVQKSSGITYRVWDWNRVGLDGKPRELHIKEAMDVANFDVQPKEDFFKAFEFSKQESFVSQHQFAKIEISSVELTGVFNYSFDAKESLFCVEGEARVNDILLKPGHSLVFLASETVKLTSKKCRLIKVKES